MAGADFGVNLAFYLTIFGTILCIVYGVMNWNKGSNDSSKGVKNWAKTEDKIDEGL